MNNGKVLSTIGIFIIAPVMMFAYITGPGSDKGYDRCPDGYEPHLYKNGLCLYESISMRPLQMLRRNLTRRRKRTK